MKTQKILTISVLALISIFASCNPPSDITTLKIISLYDTVISDDIERLKSDISEGAWLDLKNESGWTALHYATVKNSEKMIKLLIKNGADINMGDEKRDQTPLHFAAMTGKKEAVELLLANNANRHKKDINNKTALQLASNKTIIELLQK